MDRGPVAEPVTLLEREQEVERIHAVLQDAGRKAGSALVIEGAAGLGKSRLLDVARAAAPELGVRVLSALASDIEQGFPFGVMRQLFERTLLEADDSERKRWLSGAAALAADVVTGSPGAPADGSTVDDAYARQHGLYWLASNLAADAPLALVVDDLQWCDAPSVRALAFIARRLEGQPLALLLATRPLDPALTPDAAALVAGPAMEVLRVSPLTEAAVVRLVSLRLGGEPHPRFVESCLETTGGNAFLVGELLDEAAARGVEPDAAAAADIAAIVPHGVANAVLLRLARLPPQTTVVARALSVLGECTRVGDVERLSGLAESDVEMAMAALLSAGVVQPGWESRFTHPILRAAIYGELSSTERGRMHHAAAGILRARGASAGQVAPHVMHTVPAADPEAASLLREAAEEALALGDAAGAAALLTRAMEEPPTESERIATLLELGRAHARAGAPAAIGPLSEIVERGEDVSAVASAAIELSGMFFFTGRPSEGAAILRRARERIPDGEPAREQLDVALLGASSTSASVRREAEVTIASLRDSGGPAANALQATTLATLAIEEVRNLGSAAVAVDLAERAVAAGLPLEPHRGENWAVLALSVLGVTDAIDAGLQGTEDILLRARARGAAVTVVTVSALRAMIEVRCGDLIAAQADAQAAIDLAPDLLPIRHLALAVSASVLAGLERDEPIDVLRRAVDTVGAPYDSDFTPRNQLRYASGVLRAAAGDHETAVAELCGCERDHPVFGGVNPAMLSWRSAAALSLAELGRQDEAEVLADEEVRRATSFGAPRAIGVALRARALIGPRSERAETLSSALAVLEPSPARLEHARVLVDLGATHRAAGQRRKAREPLLEGLALAARCGATALQRRARAELAAIGVRPRGTEQTGPDSLTPSERRVVDLAAAGNSNKTIAQTLFVTEKTVETHLGHAFRKLDISSRRQLPSVLAGTAA